MRIALGCDHRGLPLKQVVINQLALHGHQYEDMGAYDEAPVDYPDVARRVGEAVASGHVDCGILMCGTGVGMSIAANKIRGIRAALCRDGFTARLCREHNNANVLCLGSWITGPGLAEDIVLSFINASFEGGRHRKRVDKIREMEDMA
ncbi:MAG: ribose 5-phosphate isomerase B [Chloroflexi bacterium]|nr:ribose 5-phosphate isomerase B [Chloroflexota bacterium]